MILTVTLNTAIDKAYFMENKIENGTVMRVKTVSNTAGGKGLNVARVISILGEDVLATGFAGGYNGKYLESLLDKDNVKHSFYFVEGETRSCINILDPVYGSTEYLEPGFTVNKDDADKFLSHFNDLIKGSDIVTISGSVPKGLDASIYVKMIDAVKNAGKIVVLDTSGNLLRESIKAKPHVVKPNQEELESLFNVKINGILDASKYASKLSNEGIPYVIVSLGKDGAIVASNNQVYHAVPPKINVVNTVGCGDSLVGAFSVALYKGFSVKDAIKYAVSVASANATTMGTGSFNIEDLNSILTQTKVTLL